MAHAQSVSARVAPIIVAIAPAILLAGFFYHPYFENVTDPQAIAEAVASDTTRWGIAHLTIVVGYALTTLAFLAIQSYLREAGETRWSGPALPCIIVGSTLFAALVGMEFVPLAAVETGADAEAAQDDVQAWFLPVLVAGAISFGLGLLGFASSIVRSRVLHPRLAWFVAEALTVMAGARFVPLAAGPLVMTVAGVAALWPLAFEMWTNPVGRPTERPRLMPVT